MSLSTPPQREPLRDRLGLTSHVVRRLLLWAFLVGGIGYVVGLCGVDTSFVGALPTALMKSLSGSGANGLMIDTMKELGPDSFVGRMSCVVRGASDTTFYILAVYFGSVGITKTRNAVTCGLIADFSGIIAAILISYLFFF